MKLRYNFLHFKERITPNDKVTLTLEDYLDHVKIKKVEREKNVSGAVAEKVCKGKKKNKSSLY